MNIILIQRVLGLRMNIITFGPLRTGCIGNNLKDRSAGTVIRYNWIESGNRQLDLVNTDYAEFYNDPSYNDTYVYGNVLIEPDGAGNSQMIHYGGDGGDTTYFRRGTLHLYNNTLVSTRSSNTTLVRLSTNDVTADIQNNIVYTTASPGRLALTNGAGIVKLKNNWLTEGYRNSFESSQATIVEESGNLTGATPGFVDMTAQNYKLTDTSVCIDRGIQLGAELSNHMPTMEYVKHQTSEERIASGARIDIGAYETATTEAPPAAPVITNITEGQTYLTPVGPNWVDEAGTTSIATLEKRRSKPESL